MAANAATVRARCTHSARERAAVSPPGRAAVIVASRVSSHGKCLAQ
jgi:hypothetical protein